MLSKNGLKKRLYIQYRSDYPFFLFFFWISIYWVLTVYPAICCYCHCPHSGFNSTLIVIFFNLPSYCYTTDKLQCNCHSTHHSSVWHGLKMSSFTISASTSPRSFKGPTEEPSHSLLVPTVRCLTFMPVFMSLGTECPSSQPLGGSSP